MDRKKKDRLRRVAGEPQVKAQEAEERMIDEVKLEAVSPREKNKPARNAKCPCGSGRKWKHCHGRTRTHP